MSFEGSVYTGVCIKVKMTKNQPSLIQVSEQFIDDEILSQINGNWGSPVPDDFYYLQYNYTVPEYGFSYSGDDDEGGSVIDYTKIPVMMEDFELRLHKEIKTLRKVYGNAEVVFATVKGGA